MITRQEYLLLEFHGQRRNRRTLQCCKNTVITWARHWHGVKRTVYKTNLIYNTLSLTSVSQWFSFITNTNIDIFQPSTCSTLELSRPLKPFPHLCLRLQLVLAQHTQISKLQIHMVLNIEAFFLFLFLSCSFTLCLVTAVSLHFDQLWPLWCRLSSTEW